MKNNKAKLFIETQPKPVLSKLQDKTMIRRSERIWAFLETHECININCLAKKVDYAPQNLNKYRWARKRLPQHLLLKIESVLENYGMSVG